MNHLAPIVTETVIQLSHARRDVDAWRELCEQSLALLAERDRQLVAKQRTIEALIAENRALRAGKVQAA